MSRPMVRWGTVTAAPHEFLIQLRAGEVVRAQQGGSCFKWPSDTVALVDTSVRRLQFTADQVTREKTGVQVTGLAVFRVVEPLVAYRMLNFDEHDAHVDILREMLLGATRRLVANLTLEECLTRRKEGLAAELIAEIAPVVAGRGRPEEPAGSGWGVGIDTIEIQDVRVLSEEVFSRLQAPYREGLELEAVRARDEVAREQARLAHEAMQMQERRQREQMELEEARLEAERQRAVTSEAHASDLARRQQEAKLLRDRERQTQEVELHRVRSAAQLDSERLAAAAARTQAEAVAASDLGIRQREAEVIRVISVEDALNDVRVAEEQAKVERTLGAARAETERESRAARDVISEDRLRELLVTDTLPQVARAFADSFDQIVVTGASDLSVLGSGVAQVLATARAFGVSLPTGSTE